MALTLHDITPIGLCVATLELFDTRRFQGGFCDNVLMKEGNNFPELLSLRRDLNSPSTQVKFLDGHKTAIINNIDKILAQVNRYHLVDFEEVGKVVRDGKEIMKRVFYAASFDEIGGLEAEFKKQVVLPTYKLFIEMMRRAKIDVV